jgi:hypothetical protein
MRKLNLILILAMPVYANMRAPIIVKRGTSALRADHPDKIQVLSENLEFVCPQAYTGGVNFESFAAAACDARVTYRIRADATRVLLTFVYSGATPVTWQVGDKTFKSHGAPLTAQQKSCPYCPQSLEKVQAAMQEIELGRGENTLMISYQQALSFSESSHGYFSSSQWTQSFTYELWPIAEWNQAPDFFANLTLSVATRDGFLGMGEKDDVIRCYVDEENNTTNVELRSLKATDGRRTMSARVVLKKAPQRLRCEYAGE